MKVKQAAAVFVFHPDRRRVLASRRRSPGRFFGMWHVPGGSVEAGESLIKGAQRELREETGICRGILALARVGSFQDENDSGRFECTCYATWMETDAIPPNPEPDDNTGWEWRDINELDNLMPGTAEMYRLAVKPSELE